MRQPNLFSYATSELSQDAFICWLLSWSRPEHKSIDHHLHECGVRLIQELFQKHGKSAPTAIEKIKITKQDKNIDVLCIVNEQYAVLIEDKTYTINHSGQLDRYREEVKSRTFSEEDIIPIYFKTMDQGNYSDVEDKGYKVFSRSDFLDVLNQYKGRNSILLDYRQYLQWISDKVGNYRTTTMYKKDKRKDNWDWHAWTGFYMRLQRELKPGEELKIGDWGYVANPQGGFLGFWWHWMGDKKCQQYLQLEQHKLCLKIWVENQEDRVRLRQKWHEKSKAQGLEINFPLRKPSRFGNGYHMTVNIYYDDYRASDDEGIIDIPATVGNLRKAESLLNAICESKSIPDS